MLECELKFRFATFVEAQELISSRGIALSGPVEEENAVLDSLDGSLSGKRILLRIRNAGGVTILTVKTPVEDSRMKIRKEYETEVCCPPQALEEMFAALGFRVARRYSKTRMTGRCGDATVCLDRLHFGTFIEIEAGSPEALVEAASLLGLDPSDGLRENYLELEDMAGGNV